MSTTDDVVTLSFPSDPSYLRLARLAAADAGARAGFTYEEIDDLRIGVDELSQRLLAAGGHVTITFATTSGSVEAHGEGSAPGRADPSAIALAIIRAVVDEHAFGDADGRAWFRMLKNAFDGTSDEPA